MNTLVVPPCDKAVGAPTHGQTSLPNRILFVDDSIAVREAIAKVLINSGYHVDVAEDGGAGWEALHAANYDLLITDHNMPKLPGVELVKKLRSARMNLPVVLASPMARPATIGCHRRTKNERVMKTNHRTASLALG